MARVKTKGLDKHHVIRLTERDGFGEVCLVRGGRRSYLWIGTDLKHGGGGFVGGQTALRALARAILREVPARRKRGG